GRRKRHPGVDYAIFLVLEFLRTEWGGFENADRSARGLTPGTEKKGTRPEGGGRETFSTLDAERDPQRISAAPSGRGPIVNVSWG
ncbi:MAG TPA: hypothetical protein VIH58_10730, partial [Chthoniobacterales bacterium]